MNAAPITYKVIFDRKKETAKGKEKGLVQIQAYKGKQIYFSTGIYLKPEEWNEKKAEVKSHSDRHTLNLQIQEILRQLKAQEQTGRQKNPDYSAEDLKRDYKQQEKAFTHFTPFALEQLERDRAKPNGIKLHTYLNRQQMINSFGEFAAGRDRLGAIDYALLDDYFKRHLPAEFVRRYPNNKNKTIAPGTLLKHLKTLKQYEGEAVRRELLRPEQAAFADYNRRGKNIKDNPTERAWLDPEELAQMEACTLPEELIWVRDFYLFMCYTGLRFSDAASITKDHFKTRKEGLELTVRAGKTGKKIAFPLWLLFPSQDGQPESRPERLIKKYWKANGKPFFETSNQNANRLLKTVAEAAGITGKNLTNHTARHTFASFLINRVPITVVRDLLQHSKIDTTMIYAHQSRRTIEQHLQEIDWG